jgi:hypothetical protein
MRKLALIGTTAIAAAILSAAPISVNWSAEKNLSLSQDKALAVVGRPATPGSVAGVARRSARRAYRLTTITKLVAVGPRHPLVAASIRL